MAINNTTLTNTPTQIFVGNSTETSITVIYLCNTDTVAVDVSVYAVPAGDTVGVQHLIYTDINIQPGDTFIIDTERLILNQNDTIQAEASVANVVNATVSSMEI